MNYIKELEDKANKELDEYGLTMRVQIQSTVTSYYHVCLFWGPDEYDGLLPIPN